MSVPIVFSIVGGLYMYVRVCVYLYVLNNMARELINWYFLLSVRKLKHLPGLRLRDGGAVYYLACN